MGKKHKNKGKGKGKKEFTYSKPQPKVHCSNCPAFINKYDVTIANIEEDIQGVDLVTFMCPKCKTIQKSNIFG